MVTRCRIVIALGMGALAAGGRSFAQKSKSVVRIGVLRQQPRAGSINFEAFLSGLRELGYTEGKNLLIDYRQAEGDRWVEEARDLVRSNVDLIYAPNAQEAHAARKATSTIPMSRRPRDAAIAAQIKSAPTNRSLADRGCYARTTSTAKPSSARSSASRRRVRGDRPRPEIDCR